MRAAAAHPRCVRSPSRRDGFATSLAGTTSCSLAVLQGAGPAGCAASSKLGSGDASFVFVSTQFENVFELAVSTDELSVFRGPGDEILVYALVTRPARAATGRRCGRSTPPACTQTRSP